jgi:hypothetical protein
VRSMPYLRLPLQAMCGMTVDIKNIYQHNLTTAASEACSVY